MDWSNQRSSCRGDTPERPPCLAPCVCLNLGMIGHSIWETVEANACRRFRQVWKLGRQSKSWFSVWLGIDQRSLICMVKNLQCYHGIDRMVDRGPIATHMAPGTCYLQLHEWPHYVSHRSSRCISSAFSGMHQSELVGGLLFLPIESGFFVLHPTKGVTDHYSFSTSLKGSRKSERLIRAVVAVSVVEASCSSPMSDLVVNY